MIVKGIIIFTRGLAMCERWRNTLINLYRGTKSVWTRYHFLVPPKKWKRYAMSFWKVVTNGRIRPYLDPFKDGDYRAWLRDSEKDTRHKELKYRPMISVLIPVYNAEEKYLKECIESVLAQEYENFEICIVDDASTSKETLNVLVEYEKNDKIRIKHRKKNGHISRATNDALEMAKGEFVALLDNDDVLAKNALYEVVNVLNEDRNLDFIYSDEDKLNLGGERCLPHFKPDYSPDTLLSLNYICHLAVIRTKVMREVGGFAVGLEGAQDHDLFLKVVEKTDRIYHIPKSLYHWRMTKGSTALSLDNKDYANDKGKLAVEVALKRRGLSAKVEKDRLSTYYRVIYDLSEEPLVSVIIPTKDHAKITEKCLESVYARTTYENYEVILVDNRSEEKQTFELFEKYEKKFDNFRVVKADMEFNYSKINNLAVKEAKGEVLILLNNDTEIITPEWMTWMVGYAVQPHVGAVGAKLLYSDGTNQHAGVILGLGGVAGHAYIGKGRDELGAYGRLRVPYDYGAVTAACLCVEKKKFEEVGGLEEKGLKVAFNDIDFNMKLLNKGYYNVLLPMVELYHYESKSRGADTAPEKRERFEREVRFMQKKWGKKLLNDRFYNPNLSLRWDFVLDRKKKNDEE